MVIGTLAYRYLITSTLYQDGTCWTNMYGMISYIDIAVF
ncbi:hypothetical protein BMETH_2373_1 [methanotrophic bacterial endosymbiont of Bathymodiolus sp.]|nr:hypothetical protein BMETH_2373_1 [methanotrophic bacterial endosymbiont of Bathymodiolus sp.]